MRVAASGPLVASTLELEIGAALAGLGIIRHFEEVIAPQFATGALVPLLAGWWQEFPGPLLYYPSRRLMPAPLRAFIDFTCDFRWTARAS